MTRKRAKTRTRQQRAAIRSRIDLGTRAAALVNGHRMRNPDDELYLEKVGNGWMLFVYPSEVAATMRVRGVVPHGKRVWPR